MADPRENLLVCTVFLRERFQDPFNVRDHSVELTDRSTDAACLTFRCLNLMSDGLEPNFVWKRRRRSVPHHSYARREVVRRSAAE
jgi:hypothetical protein